MWKPRIQNCTIPLGTFSNKLLSTHLWMGFLPSEQELHCLILEKMEPLLTAHYFEMTLSISIKILHVKIWTSYSTLVYITCMSHTWGLNQNNILNPVSPNGDQHQFSPTISICCPEKRLWELIEWSLTRKCFDLLSDSLNYCNSLRKCMKISMEN